MIRISTNLHDIDYNSLVELMMPYIEKSLSEKDNIVYDVINKMISREGKPTKLSKFLVSVIPNKNNLTASIFPRFNNMMIQYLNSMLLKNYIAAKVSSLTIENMEGSVKPMLKIELCIEEIDYGKIIENLVPQFIHQLSEKEDKTGKIGQLLLSLNGLPVEMLKAAIGAIPVNQRDSLIATFLNEYKKEIGDALNAQAAKNNISAEITDLKVTSI